MADATLHGTDPGRIGLEAGLDLTKVMLSGDPSTRATLWIQPASSRLNFAAIRPAFSTDASGLYLVPKHSTTSMTALYAELEQWGDLATEAFHVFEDGLTEEGR